jgi:hypothetical protein
MRKEERRVLLPAATGPSPSAAVGHALAVAKSILVVASQLAKGLVLAGLCDCQRTAQLTQATNLPESDKPALRDTFITTKDRIFTIV